MVRLDGGGFRMGTDSGQAVPGDGERPSREVEVGPFAIDVFAVSNGDFADFVEATGYVTDSERLGWSFVFEGRLSRRLRRNGIVERLPSALWWCRIDGADWRRPEGPGASIERRLDHPVVHVSHNDALAYCSWAGCRLPTEAEWEYAARGGVEGSDFPWGDELEPGGEHRCNVWEWCADWFAPRLPPAGARDPKGPSAGVARVIRGGSHLCHASYCNRYRVSARTHNTPDSATGHMGFRCALTMH